MSEQKQKHPISVVITTTCSTRHGAFTAEAILPRGKKLTVAGKLLNPAPPEVLLRHAIVNVSKLLVSTIGNYQFDVTLRTSWDHWMTRLQEGGHAAVCELVSHQVAARLNFVAFEAVRQFEVAGLRDMAIFMLPRAVRERRPITSVTEDNEESRRYEATRLDKQNEVDAQILAWIESAAKEDVNENAA